MLEFPNRNNACCLFTIINKQPDPTHNVTHNVPLLHCTDQLHHDQPGAILTTNRMKCVEKNKVCREKCVSPPGDVQPKWCRASAPPVALNRTTFFEKNIYKYI